MSSHRHSGAPRRGEPGISRFRVWSFGPSRNDEEKMEQLQFHLPGLADQALTKAAMRFAGDQHKARILIDFPRGDQNALGPQRDPAIAAGPREGDALSDQPFAQSMAAPG